MLTQLMEETGFERPLRAAALMAAFPVPWCVAGAWAIDLFLGRTNRGGHGDVEVAVFRDAQRSLHDYLYLSDWTFTARLGGEHETRWDRREYLEPPVFELRCDSADGDERLAFQLNERRGRQWKYRRLASISMPLDRAFRRGMLNVPVLAPEIVLLCKAEAPRPQDLLDCRATVDHLDDASRDWLRAAIERAHPDSPFLQTLDAA
jgi:hypothetical protein